MLGPVSTRMGDLLRGGKVSRCRISHPRQLSLAVPLYTRSTGKSRLTLDSVIVQSELWSRWSCSPNFGLGYLRTESKQKKTSVLAALRSQSEFRTRWQFLWKTKPNLMYSPHRSRLIEHTGKDVAAPSTWNSLPADIRLCESILTLKRHLKIPSVQTHLVLLCCLKRLCIFGP